MSAKFKIAIIGRPNVGKSSIFNKICAKRIAIVEDTPGVTRDRKEYKAEFRNMSFDMVDTAGWECSNTSVFTNEMNKQSCAALDEADIIWFVLDAKTVITRDDIELADIVRKANKPTILILNKSEGRKNIDLDGVYKMGFSDPIYISVNANAGFHDLYDEVEAIVSTLIENGKMQYSHSNKDRDNGAIRAAVIGRPNVGKSTIFNKLLGMERSIVSEHMGTTRDSIVHQVTFEDGSIIELIDTAGMRKRKNVNSKLEDLSNAETINAIRRCHIVVLVIEATDLMLAQDIAIARIAINEGKPIVIVINKMDIAPDPNAVRPEMEYILRHRFTDMQGINTLYISALKKQALDEIYSMVKAVYKLWSTKLTTGKLNKWLAHAIQKHNLPLAKNNRRIKLKYMVQNAVRPPTFTIFANIIDDFPESYHKYLLKSLKEYFDLNGTIIRLSYKKSDNPYSKNQ